MKGLCAILALAMLAGASMANGEPTAPPGPTRDAAAARAAAVQDIYHNLLFNDTYYVLKDFGSYSMAQRRVDSDYQNREKWLRMAITNTACSGIFSSDRTIREYNDQIWHLK